MPCAEENPDVVATPSATAAEAGTTTSGTRTSRNRLVGLLATVAALALGALADTLDTLL
jgi:hypothetical protein